MTRLRISFVAAAALATAACAGGIVAPQPATTSESRDAVLTAARSFAAAEIEWQSAIAVGRALTARGLIRGETAASVRRWNAEARTLIVDGKRAIDAAGKARAAAGLLRLVGKLDILTGRK